LEEKASVSPCRN